MLCAAALWPLVSSAAEEPRQQVQGGQNRLARAFLDGVQAYEEENYEAAIRAFSEAAAAGVRNGKLFFNLGNAYLKNGDVGRAILWYERAALLLRRDADLQFNLEYARGLTRDETEDPGVDLVRILLFWNDELGTRTVRVLAIGSNAVFWGLLALWFLTRRRVWKTPLVITAIAALVLTLTALFNYHRASRAADGIIIPAEVVVRSGVTETSTELFRLHAGTRVQVDRQQVDHVRITFLKDRIGWIPAETVGLVRELPGRF
jgi:tetratricopeptide (TPR) repeat protein